MTVEEAAIFSSPVPSIARMLKTLGDVGLGIHETRTIRHDIVRRVKRSA